MVDEGRFHHKSRNEERNAHEIELEQNKRVVALFCRCSQSTSSDGFENRTRRKRRAAWTIVYKLAPLERWILPGHEDRSPCKTMLTGPENWAVTASTKNNRQGGIVVICTVTSRAAFARR